MTRARFEELRFYQLAVTLLKAAYKLAEGLPGHEKYNLASQLRRAALSTTLNIAEGYGRYSLLPNSPPPTPQPPTGDKTWKSAKLPSLPLAATH